MTKPREKNQLATYGRKPSEMDILHSVMEWKKNHRPPIDEEDVGTAIWNLNIFRWIDADFCNELPWEDKELMDVDLESIDTVVKE
jgi:hypothetical protein